jgi:hypothetical protein
MNNPGSLIQLHYHDNLKILECLTEDNNSLCYKGIPVSLSIVTDEEIQQAITDTLNLLKEEES